MRMNILETTYQELSDMDIAFIEAMLPGEGPSSTAEIARRMGKSSAYASQYRRHRHVRTRKGKLRAARVAGIHRGEARRGRNLQRPSRLLMKEAGGIAPSGCHFKWSG
jgi:hypothetical protein